MLQELRGRIGLLTFPKKGLHQAEEKVAARSDSDTESLPENRPPLQRSRSETACCILSRKPVEKILIRCVLFSIITAKHRMLLYCW